LSGTAASPFTAKPVIFTPGDVSWLGPASVNVEEILALRLAPKLIDVRTVYLPHRQPGVFYGDTA